MRKSRKDGATDLVFGVLRNRSAIDLVIEKISSRLVKRIPNKILNTIRVGVYELIYCPQAAEYAIVDEAVDYSKRITNVKQAGFVNAVLRQTLRHILSRQIPLEEAQPLRTMPQTTNTGCEFDIEILPDADESPRQYLSCAFSLRDWLVKSWIDEYGEEQTKAICIASNRRPSIYLRPNSLKTTSEELAGKLKADGVECETTAEKQMIKLTSPGVITTLPGFDKGLFTVQDFSAAHVVGLLKPKPGWMILDLCAAPGTKTTQLAEATGGRSKIVATDIDNDRLEMVRENITRLGLSDYVTVIEYRSLDESAQRSGGFDCILVDAPCSNTGVLARRPEARHRITKETINGLAKTQMELLSKAADMLKPQGVICYSTCSIQLEENSGIVRRFIKKHPDFKLESERLILPSAEAFDHDGGYAAVLVGEIHKTSDAKKAAI